MRFAAVKYNLLKASFASHSASWFYVLRRKNRQSSRTPNYLFRLTHKQTITEWEKKKRGKNTMHEAINNGVKWIFMCCLLFKYTFGPERCRRAEATIEESNVAEGKKNVIIYGYTILAYSVQTHSQQLRARRRKKNAHIKFSAFCSNFGGGCCSQTHKSGCAEFSASHIWVGVEQKRD